jgi:hypothetical protein
VLTSELNDVGGEGRELTSELNDVSVERGDAYN